MLKSILTGIIYCVSIGFIWNDGDIYWFIRHVSYTCASYDLIICAHFKNQWVGIHLYIKYSLLSWLSEFIPSFIIYIFFFLFSVNLETEWHLMHFHSQFPNVTQQMQPVVKFFFHVKWNNEGQHLSDWWKFSKSAFVTYLIW